MRFGLQVLKESDIIISDLPVGYYPDDSIASRYEVASSDEHTYAHHLLMEQSLKYLKPGGYAIFLAPNDLLTSAQAPLLKMAPSQGSVYRDDNLTRIYFLKQQACKTLCLEETGSGITFSLLSILCGICRIMKKCLNSVKVFKTGTKIVKFKQNL